MVVTPFSVVQTCVRLTITDATSNCTSSNEKSKTLLILMKDLVDLNWWFKYQWSLCIFSWTFEKRKLCENMYSIKVANLCYFCQH